MTASGEGAGWSWRRLWCVPQTRRETLRTDDWNRLEMNAIGSAWGRDRRGFASGVYSWEATIVAELTR